MAICAAGGSGELSIPALKKYIQYCKAKCSPRLSDESGEVLVSNYVKIRDDVRRRGESDVIPITVRQLEALVRIAESLAKMRLDDEVRAEDIAESMRLFRVSTMAANQATDNDGLGGIGGVGTNQREELERTEAFLRARLTIGSLINRQRLMEEAAGQGHHAALVAKALAIMAGRGQVLERNQGRLVKRIK
jgi:DNA replication licensing factor MCM5